MKISPLHQEIKESTKFLHSRLEEMEVAKKMVDLSLSREEYIEYLSAMLYLHTAVEKQLQLYYDDFKNLDLDLNGYMRKELLLQDMKIILGSWDVNTTSYEDIQIPLLDSFAKAIGCLYVLTGSTMGVVILAQKVEENPHLQDFKEATHYFKSFGEQTFPRWQAFLAFLNTAGEKNREKLFEDDLKKGVAQTYELIAKVFHALT